MRLLLVLSLVLGLTAAGAHAAKPRRTFTVAPKQQFVTVPVRIRGAHWPRGTRCPGRVRVSVRLPSGRTAPIGRPPVTSDGSFRASWRPPVGTGGHTVRLHAVEACGSAGTVSAATSLKVLPTPH